MKSENPKGSRFLRACLVVQAVAILVAWLVPFGFDKPSSWGLDFGHLLLVVALYGTAFIAGIVAAVMRNRLRIVLLQVAIPLVILAGTMLGLGDVAPKLPDLSR